MLQFPFKKYIIRPKRDKLRKMQLQGLLAGNLARVLWITRPVPLPLSYRSRYRQLWRELSIYINEMVMPVKYMVILIIINLVFTLVVSR